MTTKPESAAGQIIPWRSMKPAEKDRAILEFVGMQGVATSAQGQQWFGLRYEKPIRDRMTKMSNGNNPLLTHRNLPRPWASRYRVYSAFLTDAGAAVLNEMNGTTILAPSQATQEKNFVHGLGIVDIAIALKRMGLSCDMERRMDIPDDDDGGFIRPDILCHLDGSHMLIEFEQTRSEQNLSERLLGRLRRWQEIFTSPVMRDVLPDVIVLFAMKESEDRYTTSTWSKVLYELSQELGGSPAFSVWSMSIADFLNNPTLDLRRYKRLIPSLYPDSDALADERERFFHAQAVSVPTLPGLQKAWQAARSYHLDYRGRLTEMQLTTSVRKAFLDCCDDLFSMVISGPESSRWNNGGVPWIGIGVLRCWFEQPSMSDFRLRLINALESLKSSYGRGLYSAADTLERMVVWGTILRQFGFGRGGPLAFYAQVGTSEKDQDRRSGLIPVFTISSPWPGIREDQDAANVTVQALTWLVQTLMDYPVELGLTKENKKALSSVTLNSPNHAGDIAFQDINSDPPVEEP
ncbi:MAG: hypothetical protein HPY85_10425 [Anaerolineae bacterium]|nr:hypothetical protein [Anaerolineae bacterium]